MTKFMYKCGGIGAHDNAVENYVFTPVKTFLNISRIFAQSVITYLMGKKKLNVPTIFSSDSLDSPVT